MSQFPRIASEAAISAALILQRALDVVRLAGEFTVNPPPSHAVRPDARPWSALSDAVSVYVSLFHHGERQRTGFFAGISVSVEHMFTPPPNRVLCSAVSVQ